jgi:hypothetical protein
LGPKVGFFQQKMIKNPTFGPNNVRTVCYICLQGRFETIFNFFSNPFNSECCGSPRTQPTNRASGKGGLDKRQTLFFTFSTFFSPQRGKLWDSKGFGSFRAMPKLTDRHSYLWKHMVVEIDTCEN